MMIEKKINIMKVKPINVAKLNWRKVHIPKRVLAFFYKIIFDE